MALAASSVGLATTHGVAIGVLQVRQGGEQEPGCAPAPCPALTQGGWVGRLSESRTLSLELRRRERVYTNHLLKIRSVGAGASGAGNFSFKRDLGSKVKEDHLRVC